MATRKKAATTVNEVKLQRYEVGYVFNIPVTVVSVDEDAGEDGEKYQVNIDFYGSDTGNGWEDRVWFSRDDLLCLEAKSNPSVIKEELQIKLDKAKALVESITKEIAQLG